jgi:hypothetical protein
MVAEVYAGLSAFKTMFDMAKGLKDINDAAIRNGAVIELQEKILAAREAQTTLLERVGELEKQVAGFEAWEAEKQRYSLRELPPGVFVRALNPEMAGAEPSHFICETCFQRGKKRTLHSDEARNGIYHLKCHECDTTLQVGHITSRARHADSDYDPWSGR